MWIAALCKGGSPVVGTNGQERYFIFWEKEEKRERSTNGPGRRRRGSEREGLNSCTGTALVFIFLNGFFSLLCFALDHNYGVAVVLFPQTCFLGSAAFHLSEM